jgi:hypothetical protein
MKTTTQRLAFARQTASSQVSVAPEVGREEGVGLLPRVCQATLRSGKRCRREGQPILVGGLYANYCFPHRRLLREKLEAEAEARRGPMSSSFQRKYQEGEAKGLTLSEFERTLAEPPSYAATWSTVTAFATPRRRR